MLWFTLALSTAILASVNDVLRKLISQKADIVVIPFFSSFVTFLIMLCYSFFRGFPKVGLMFFIVVLINACLNAIASVLYVYALKHGDISLGVPMLSFTPAFMILTSFLLLGELPNAFGAAGIVLIVSGAYLLTSGQKSFEYLKKEKSPKIFLLIAGIWSVTANLDKLGTKLATPEFYIACVSFCVSTFLLPFVWKRIRCEKTRKNLKLLGSIGIVNSAMLLAQMHALLLAKASYVIAIKRLSTVFSAIFGGKFFRERELRKRTVAAAVMFSGVVLIVVLGKP